MNTPPLGLARIRETAVDDIINRVAGALAIIGDVEQASAGNSILRVGRVLPDGKGWMQTEHIVLTPAERESLIAALIGHRAAAEFYAVGSRVEIEEQDCDPSRFPHATIVAAEARHVTHVGYEVPGYVVRYDNGCEVWVRESSIRRLAATA